MSKTLICDSIRDLAVWYAKKWIGTPYVWGGDDFSGFDCSGYIHEILQGIGWEQRGFDSTAHDLYLNYKDKKPIGDKAYPGCLVFWFTGNRATHVEIVIHIILDQISVLGASGGGSKTKTREDAILHNAYIKMNQILYRGQNYKIVDPFKDD